MGTEKFCLRWNDFESNISVAFRELRDDKDFFDVTLACDDEQIESHKMILSACSPFFRNILRRNPHQHPLIYLKGVKFVDLQSVLNFMYHGEVNVAQEELNSFLAVAEDLRVKGLTQNRADIPKTKAEHYSQPRSITLPKTHQRPPNQDPAPPPKRSRPAPAAPAPPSTLSSSHFSPQGMEDDVQEVVPVKTEPRDPPPQTAPPTAMPPSQDTYATPGTHSLAPIEDDSFVYQDDQYAEYEQYEDGQEYGGGGDGVRDQASYAPVEGNAGQTFQDPSELLQFVRKDPQDNKFYCTLCERFSHKARSMTRNHVESQHFPNFFSYPCEICGDVLTTKSNLWLHRSRKHLNKKHSTD
eukprot:GFUD01007571.1.p1 GENE.GFUD01007571.1~~GFUD01007571.1.p1  ORF type:complete len:367 (-),score=83.46 GFUD01007571.1:1-1062(-)